jgi:hypothetical protein
MHSKLLIAWVIRLFLAAALLAAALLAAALALEEIRVQALVPIFGTC